MIVITTPARIGLIGNPSDGFHGKTISLTIKNYFARVWLNPNPNSTRIEIKPHSEFDPTVFNDFTHVAKLSRRDGYCTGGLRILQATCTRFYKNCKQANIILPKKGFTLIYDTNIPRQVGMAGSSAIITSAMKAFLKYFEIGDKIEKPDLARWISEVETEELGLAAGLQDRVVQVYRGLVFMDFDAKLFEEKNSGNYEKLDVASLPDLFLVRSAENEPSDSGKIHSDVKNRWGRGDLEVIKAMENFASFADEFKALLVRTRPDSSEIYLKSRVSAFQELFRKNFSQRLAIYGKEVIGSRNMSMIEIVGRHNTAGKFCGSGGAVIGVKQSSSVEFMNMVEELRKSGFVVEDIVPDDGILE